MASIYAPDWTDVERKQWIEDYRAGRPVLMPYAEHDICECKHCDVLRTLMARADKLDDQAA